MILVKASADSEADVMPPEELLEVMADYHEELARTGVFVDGNGLQRSAGGWRIPWSGGRKTVIDGPFAVTKELIPGFTIIRVRSRKEAIAWADRFPNPGLEDGKIEVRQMFELDDFGESPAIDPFREMGVATEKC